MINKRKFEIRNNKKVLHKAGKQWLTISTLMLALIGGSTLVGKTTHADTISNNDNHNNQQSAAQPITNSHPSTIHVKTASSSVNSINKLATRFHGSLVNHAVQTPLQTKAPHAMSVNAVKHAVTSSINHTNDNQSNLNKSNLPHTKSIIPSDNKKHNTEKPKMLFSAAPSSRGFGTAAPEQSLGTVNLTYNGASVKPMSVSDWLKDTLHKPSFTFSINNNTYFVPGPSDSSDNYFSDNPSDSTLAGINNNIEHNLKINKNNITYTVQLNKLNKINVELGHMVNNKYTPIKPKHIKKVNDKVLHITSSDKISDEGIIGTTHDIDNTSFTLPLVAGQFIPKYYSYNIKHIKYDGEQAPNQLKNYYVLNQHSLAQKLNSDYGNTKFSNSDDAFYYANEPYTIYVVLKPRPVKLASDYINYTCNGSIIKQLFNRKGDTTKKDFNIGQIMSDWVSDWSSDEYPQFNIPKGYTISTADKNYFKNIFSQRMDNKIKFGSAQYNIPLKSVAQPANKTNYIEYTYNGQVIKTAYHSNGPANSDDSKFSDFMNWWPTSFNASNESSDIGYLHDHEGLPQGYTMSLQNMSTYHNKLANLSQTPIYGSIQLQIPVKPVQAPQPQQNLGTIKVEFVDDNGNALQPSNNGLQKSDKYLHINGNIVSDTGKLNFTHDPNDMAFDFDTVMTPFMPKGYTNAGQIHEKGLKGQYDLLSHIVGAKLTKTNVGSDHADRIYTLKNGQQLYFRNDGSNDFALDYMSASTSPIIKIGVVPAGTVTVNKYDTDNHNKLMSTHTYIGAQNTPTNIDRTAPKGYEPSTAHATVGDPLLFNTKSQTIDLYYMKTRTNDAINYMNKDIHDPTAQVINDVPYRGIKGTSDTDMNDFVAKLEQDINNTKPNQVPDVSNLPGIPKGFSIAQSDIDTNIGDELNSFTGENSDSTSGITYGNNTLKFHLVPDVSVNFITNKHHKLLNHILVARPLYGGNIYNYVSSQYKLVKTNFDQNANLLTLIMSKPIQQSTITIHYIADEGKGKANPVIGTKAVTGNVNDPFDTTNYLSQIPSGYEYKRVSGVDKFTKRNQNVYVYLTEVKPPKLTISTITINYKDGAKTIASSNVSRPVSTDFDIGEYLSNIPNGYEYKGIQNDVDHFDYNNHIVNVLISKAPTAKVAKSTITVNYVDAKSGQVIQKAGSDTENITTPFDIDNYLSNLPSDYEYAGIRNNVDSFDYNNHTVNVLLKKITPAKVAKSTITVDYIDNGNIISSTKDTQPVSTDYDVGEHLNIPSGYIYKGIQNSNVNDFHYNDQVIKVFVSKEPNAKVAQSTINVNFVNADTPNHQLIKKLGSSTKNITTPFDISKYLNNIPDGYEYAGIKNNVNSFDYDNHTIDILLKKVAPAKVAKSTITVDYIDNGNIISATKDTEPVSTNYDVGEHLNIPQGYVYKGIQNSSVNDFHYNDQVIKVFVSKEPQPKVAKSTITVNYVDAKSGQVVQKAGSDTEDITTPFDIGNYLNNIPNGYEYDGIQNNVNSFDYDNHTINILVRKIAPAKVAKSTITVNYINNGKVVRAITATEPVSTDFNMDGYLETIPSGYEYAGIKGSVDHFDYNNHTIDILLTKVPHRNVAQSTITVNYINTKSGKAIKSLSTKANVSTDFDATSYLSFIPNGYEYSHMTGSIDHFGYNNHTVDIYVSKPQAKVAYSTITVNYINSDNNIVKTISTTKPVSTSFNSNDFKYILPDGYKFVGLQNPTDHFKYNDQTINVRVAKAPVTPANHKQASSGNTQPTSSGKAQPNSTASIQPSSAKPANSTSRIKPSNKSHSTFTRSSVKAVNHGNHGKILKPEIANYTNHSISTAKGATTVPFLAKNISTQNIHSHNARVNRNKQSKLPQTNESSVSNFMIASILLGIISTMLLSYGYDSKRKHI